MSLESTPTKQPGSESGDDVAQQEYVSSQPRPEMVGRTTARALSTSSDGLILFDLTNESGGRLEFSPHCVKSIVDLKLLNIGYERQRLSFVEVRSHLEKRIMQGVTVPSVELSDGSHLTDSWKIAEVSTRYSIYGRCALRLTIPPRLFARAQYLEAKHPSGHLLFPSPSAKAYAAFMHEYGRLLAPHISVLAIPGVASILDPASKDYFINSKLGSAKYNRALNATGAEKAAHIESAQKILTSVESTLALGGHRSPTGQKWLAATDQPSHADACLFGWYVYTRPAGQAVTREVWNAHPHVAAWVKDMLAWCGDEIVKDFV